MQEVQQLKRLPEMNGYMEAEPIKINLVPMLFFAIDD